MENLKNCVENGVDKEQQYEVSKPNEMMDYDEMDNKVFDFEAHFNGNGLCSGDEYSEQDDGSLENR